MAEKEWYHDSISRKESEAKLIESGIWYYNIQNINIDIGHYNQPNQNNFFEQKLNYQFVKIVKFYMQNKGVFI